MCFGDKYDAAECKKTLEIHKIEHKEIKKRGSQNVFQCPSLTNAKSIKAVQS